MLWQWLAVTFIVATATLFLARRAWRTWTRQGQGCAGGCGCAAQPKTGLPTSVTLISADELRLRPRSR